MTTVSSSWADYLMKCHRRLHGWQLGSITLITLASLVLGTSASADNSICNECHADASMFEDYGERAEMLVVSDLSLAHSSHEGFDCVDCHVDLDGFNDYPHGEELTEVDAITRKVRAHPAIKSSIAMISTHHKYFGGLQEKTLIEMIGDIRCRK